MSRPPKAGSDTRSRILDAAERLVIQHGYAATSVRMITREAGVPVALVNYHFGSKQGLMEAIYARALDRPDEPRVGYLDRLEAQADGAPLAVEVLVDAFISTALRLTRRENLSGTVFKQLIGQAFYEPGNGGEAFFPAEYQDTIERYKRAFLLALPELSEEDVLWRMYFFVGIVAYVMAGKDALQITCAYGLADAGNPGRILARLRPFIVAGFQAPPGQAPDLARGEACDRI
ncbi:MAG: TetR family transcriptional regulator [Zoogloeaceae bacterium]|nr:TetR family transcriptional regulator [Zoogloeaceae bacterium]